MSAILPTLVVHNDHQLGKVEEPDYDGVITPAQIRRMSRIMRIGIWTAMNALKDASLTAVDSILTTTAFGAIEDTEKFLNSLNNETGTGSPTSFIQSTHNVVGGQLALALGCNGYNMTYSQRGFTFESALLDASILLKENSQQILCGVTDELHPAVLRLIGNGNYRPESEMFAFFVLSDQPGPKCYGVIQEIVLELFDQSSFKNKVEEVIQNNSLNNKSTLVLCGDANDATLVNESFQIKTLIHETGYMTTFSSYAMYKACTILADNEYENILIVHQDQGEYYKCLLIQKNH